MTSPHDMVNVRYMVDDVQAAVDFYTGHLGFALRSTAAPAFADVSRGNLRLLLAGPASSAGRPMPDGRTPGPGVRPSGIGRPAELAGPASSSRRLPRLTSANAGAAVNRSAKPRWPV